MPKAIGKTRHGRQASVIEQSLAQVSSAAPSAMQPVMQDPMLKSTGSHHKSHRGHKGATSSSRDEKRRDNVLNKICSKASSSLQAGVPSGETSVPPLRSPAEQLVSTTPDQLSLRDCPISILMEGLWGASSAISEPPLLQPPVPPVPAQDSVLPESSAPQLMGTEQLQRLIEAAVQKSLAGHVAPSARVPSVVVCPSIDPVSDDQDDCIRFWCYLK